MDDRFTADVATLRDAGRQGHAVTAQLRTEAKNALREDGNGLADAGHGALGHEIAAFQAKTGDLATRVTDEGDSIGDRLIETALAYENTDTEAADRLSRIHGGSHG